MFVYTKKLAKKVNESHTHTRSQAHTRAHTHAYKIMLQYFAGVKGPLVKQDISGALANSCASNNSTVRRGETREGGS